jgi:hypothetical protein
MMFFDGKLKIDLAGFGGCYTQLKHNGSVGHPRAMDGRSNIESFHLDRGKSPFNGKVFFVVTYPIYQPAFQLSLGPPRKIAYLPGLNARCRPKRLPYLEQSEQLILHAWPMS